MSTELGVMVPAVVTGATTAGSQPGKIDADYIDGVKRTGAVEK